MTHKEYKAYHKQMCEKMIKLTEDKNSDYCGDDPSAFANFERVEKEGVTSTEVGILTRMMDKYARLNTFVKKGAYKVEDEKVADTCADLANYAIMLSAVIQSKKQKDE